MDKGTKRAAIIAGSIVGAIFIIGLIGSIVDPIEESSGSKKGNGWNDMTTSEHREWIQDFVSDPSAEDQFLLQYVIQEMVTDHFKYRKTVEFTDEYSWLSRAQIIDPDSGICTVVGEVTAENGFGVPVDNYFYCGLILTKDTQYLTSLNVLER